MEAGSTQRVARPQPVAAIKKGNDPGIARISRQQQAEITRHRLAETALLLFSERGYDRVTVDDICRAAGVSKGTFYVYFKSKDQVLVEEFLDLDRFYLDSMQELAEIESCIEQLLTMGRYSLRHLAGLGKDYLKVAFSSQISPGRGPSPVASKVRASYKVTLRLVREAQKRGELRPDLSSEEVAMALVRAIRGIVFEWCLLDGRFDLEQEGEVLLKILTDGLRPPEKGCGSAKGPSRKRRG